MKTRTLVLASWAMLATGCVGNKLEQSFAAGQYLEVAAMFESDSSLQMQERALYRAGLVYGLPRSPAYSPERALEALDRLLEMYPNSSYRQHALHLQQLLYQVRDTQATVVRREADLAVLNTRLDDQGRQLEEVEALLAKEAARGDSLRTVLDRLELEIQQRDREIQALDEELSALKEIDLNRRSTAAGDSTESPQP